MSGNSTRGKPVAAFVVSLIAGLWMTAVGGMMGWGGQMMRGPGQGGNGSYEWMWQHHRMMHAYAGGPWSWIGIAAGIVVLIGAVALYSRPSTAKAWGIVILAASVADLLAGAGGLLAGILGMVGGILAMTWQR